MLAEPGVAVVHSPGQRTTWEAVTGIETLWVTLDRLAVERELAHLLDRSVSAALEFEAAWSLATPSGRTLTRLTRFLAEEFNDLDDPRAQASLAVRQAAGTLLPLVLEGQPHNYTAALTEPARDTALRVLRRVEECVEAQLSEPLTLGDLAAWGGVGVRTLQLLFQRHRGCTPLAFVRRRRLHEARLDLLAGGPGVSVTAWPTSGDSTTWAASPPSTRASLVNRPETPFGAAYVPVRVPGTSAAGQRRTRR